MPYKILLTVANTINVTYSYAWHMVGRLHVTQSNVQWLFCNLIGCIFYSIHKVKNDHYMANIL